MGEELEINDIEGEISLALASVFFTLSLEAL